MKTTTNEARYADELKSELKKLTEMEHAVLDLPKKGTNWKKVYEALTAQRKKVTELGG